MSNDVVIFGYVLCLIGFLAMWGIMNKIEKQIKGIERRVINLEQDEFLRIAFQTDSERLDLYIKRQMEAIADRKIQEQRVN